MIDLKLANPPLYPVVYNKDHARISDARNFSCGIQREGKMAGTPVLFLNLHGCNLCCIHKTEHGYHACKNNTFIKNSSDVLEYSKLEIFKHIEYNKKNVNHLVITGGEPYLQYHSLLEFLKDVKKRYNFHITLETNGTLYYPGLIKYVDFVSFRIPLSTTPTVEKCNAVELDYEDSMKSIHNASLDCVDSLYHIILECHGNKIPTKDETPEKLTDYELKFIINDKVDMFDIDVVYMYKLKYIDKSNIFLIPAYNAMLDSYDSSNFMVEAAIKNKWKVCQNNNG